MNRRFARSYFCTATLVLAVLASAATTSRTTDAGQAQQTDPPLPGRAPGVATQPAATRPATRDPSLRRPAQAEILRNLLRQEHRPEPIYPRDPAREDVSAGGANGQAGADALWLEGETLVEKPCRLSREGGRSLLSFVGEGENAATRVVEALPNQLLELMERELESGVSEFIVSAEITRYRGANYLLVRKVLRRVGHGNVAP